MKLKTVCILSLLLVSLTACSYVPSVDSVFPDQKESYKKARELPPLEVPPNLTASSVQDEYDGAGDRTAQTVALKGEAVQLKQSAEGSYLMINDTLRSAWRDTYSALVELEYDIEDKNRDQGLIYLELIRSTDEEKGMLSSLAFWNSTEVAEYVVKLSRVVGGVHLEVVDAEMKPRNDAVSLKLLNDLLSELN